MICPECGHKIEDGSKICLSCGCKSFSEDVFNWSELPPMPVFNKLSSDNSQEEEETVNSFFSKRIKRNIIRVFTVFIEICILAGVISGIYVWKIKNTSNTVPDAQNIVYSSEDIVMMLVRNRDKWLLETPVDGSSACCFIDMDFDGSPELISISYDDRSVVTKIAAFRIRSCALENISVNYDESSGFFDIKNNLSLCYAPDTKEMLYISTDHSQIKNQITTTLGCFYLHENQIFKEYFFSETLSDNKYSYNYYDKEQSIHAITKQEFFKYQKDLAARLTDLKLKYEWISGSRLEDISSQKLAALLLRSYDSFSYDSSGLALQ